MSLFNPEPDLSSSELIARWRVATLEEVKAELENGANIEAQNRRRWTPLHTAAGFNESPEMAELLLDRGASLEARDGSGWTPLHHATRYKASPEKVKLLLDRGADLEAVTEAENTPLLLAAEGGNSEVAELLLARGANGPCRS